MATQETVVIQKKSVMSLGDKLLNIMKFVEEEALTKRVVISYDAEWCNGYAQHLQSKYPALKKFTTAQLKGALKLLLRELTVEAVAGDGFIFAGAKK